MTAVDTELLNDAEDLQGVVQAACANLPLLDHLFLETYCSAEVGGYHPL